VNSESDPVQLYKGYMEYACAEMEPAGQPGGRQLRGEVQVDVDRQGNLSNPVWQKGSGDNKWDDSVKAVFKEGDGPLTGRRRRIFRRRDDPV
jgi:hypothetical protein